MAAWVFFLLLAAPAAAQEHPRLLLTPAEAEQLRERVRTDPWTQSVWQELNAAADTLLSTDVVLPPRGGTWTHWYVSPKDGQKLKLGRRIGPWTWEHVSPRTGEVFLGDTTDIRYDYDGVAILEVHRSWARAARDLGLAYQVTEDPRYADKVREILLAYAEKYLTYPLMNKQGRREMDGNGWARVTKQSISESSWLSPLVQGADLVWETLSEAEREAVTEKVFKPAARDVILPHRYNRAHNIQAWKNAAVGLVGLLTDDRKLIEEAVHNPREGYYFQLEEGLTPDGHWFERSPYYHWVALEPILILAKAMEGSGLDARPDLLKPMLDAPLDIVRPDLTLPQYADSDPVDLREISSFYEWGYSRFRDPRYLRVLQASERGLEEERLRGFTLIHGVPQLPDEDPPRPRTSDYPETGFAILIDGRGPKATWASLKYDPWAGGHSHYDELSFDVFGAGEVITEDPGRTGYGAPVHREWYKTSLSHNTLVVDEAQQSPSEGKVLAFGSSGGSDYVVADAGPIYEGVRFRRSVALLDRDVVLVMDQVRAEEPRLLELAFHPSGTLQGLPEGQAWSPPDTLGYMHLENATIRPMKGTVSFRVKRERGTTGITYSLEGPAEVITGTGPGPLGVPVPAVLVRSRAARLSLPLGITVDGAPLEIRRVAVQDGGERTVDPAEAMAVEVRHPDGRRWLVLANPGSMSVQAERAGTRIVTRDPFVVRRMGE